ncbi:hypothetical protein FRC02_004395 [Tulasnella sp. 418]|nr:hypothetical protein FRC02_004395 [Tulasnella sp. 418]
MPNNNDTSHYIYHYSLKSLNMAPGSSDSTLKMRMGRGLFYSPPPFFHYDLLSSSQIPNSRSYAVSRVTTKQSIIFSNTDGRDHSTGYYPIVVYGIPAPAGLFSSNERLEFL